MTVVNDNCSRTTWLFANSKLQCNQPLKKDASAASSKSSQIRNGTYFGAFVESRSSDRAVAAPIFVEIGGLLPKHT